MQVILAKEKHGDHVVGAEDGTLESAALKLLSKRVEDGYWYYDEDAIEAQQALDAGGDAAWEFLESRRDHEYEWVEEQTV